MFCESRRINVAIETNNHSSSRPSFPNSQTHRVESQNGIFVLEASFNYL